ncbi:MAG: carboxypeptidase-like regulatory domain-containing protein [Acidobacteriia bacterium]|nr:carboxypeptidase-like regulatory domain-containing protein [Terriglobia bacterium]
MLQRRALVVAVLGSVFFLSPLLYSQASGSLSGTVADKTGSVIAGATVKITAQETGATRDTKTDGSGHYLAPLLPVAHYTIRVESQGFQTTEQKDIRLQVDEQREINFSLNPASVTSTVEVSATEVAVETTNPTLGQVITAEQVANLPLNGRNFVQLATLTPGTTQQTNPNSFFSQGASSEVAARGTFSLSVGGSREQSTDWLLDNNNNDETTSGGIGVLPTMDSIQEFKVLTYNYSAEYGTRAGPTVLVTTKSGTNKWHGALYEYLRNTKFDAKSYFAAFKEKFNLNQFGGSLGGPIQKDKTFFFVNYEAKRQRKGIPFTGLIPTQAMMGINTTCGNPAVPCADYTLDPLGGTRGVTQYNGLIAFPNLVNPYDFLSFQCDATGAPTAVNADGSQVTGVNCNKIPITGGPTDYGLADPIGLQMIALYPQSGTPNPAAGVNFANVPVRKLNEGNATIRMDHSFSSKDASFARFTYDQANSFVPGGSETWAEQNAFGSNQLISNHARNAVISETHIFNSKNINQAYVGYNRIFNHIMSFGEFGAPICQAANIGILGADLNSKCPNAPPGLTQTLKDCLSCGMTSVLSAQYWALGDRGFAPFQGGTNVFTFSDTFDMIRGRHDLRVGIGVRFNQMNVMTNGFQDGVIFQGGAGASFTSSFTGDNIADLLIGQTESTLHDQTFFGATTGRRWKMFRPFVQDDWRVTNNLTLNLGLAWALVTPITEAQGRQANFDWATKQFLIAGKAPFNGCTICVHTDGAVGIKFDKTALEPRIGLAWTPFGRQNTVIRAGYAIYHDSGWSQGAQGLWQNPPYYAETDNFNYGNGFPCPFGNWTLTASDPNVQPCGLKYTFMLGNGFTPPLTPYLSPPNPQAFTGTYLSQNRNFKQGMVQQFNFNVERQLPGNIVLTAGYAGTRSTHILFYGLNLNTTSPLACFPQYMPGFPFDNTVVANLNYDPNYHLGCTTASSSQVYPVYPYPAAPFAFPSFVYNISDGARARYDGLLIRAETKSARHGLYALLSYTWSRTFDTGMADGDGTTPGAQFWPLPGTRRADWGLSQLNLNDQFTASVLYDLPFGKGKHYGGGWNAVEDGVLGGWQVNVIEKATSGFPLFIVDSANNSGAAFFWNATPLNRPDQVCNPKLSHPTVNEWFNTSCFVPAAPGKLGNASRAPVYGPRFVNTDFSALKNFRLHEGYNLQFRGEFFNLFNHSEFYLSGSSATLMQDIESTSTFGKVNGTVNTGRVVQLALRLDF